jgi:hypothetical protein
MTVEDECSRAYPLDVLTLVCAAAIPELGRLAALETLIAAF